MNAWHAWDSSLSIESPRTRQSSWSLVSRFTRVSSGSIVSGVTPNSLLRREGQFMERPIKIDDVLNTKKKTRLQLKEGSVFSTEPKLTCPLGPGSPDKPCHSTHRDFVIFKFNSSIISASETLTEQQIQNECLHLLLQRVNMHHCFTVM